MYDAGYYNRYKEKNFLGLEKGERPFLYAFWMRKLKKLLPRDASILEIGCGCGYFLKRLEKGFRVIGSDISRSALKITKDKVGAPLYCASAQMLPHSNDAFSCVVALDIIEHLKSPVDFVRESFRVLKNGGIFIFTTPNPHSIGARLKGGAPPQKGLPPDKRLREWQGFRDDTHINIKTIGEWRELITSNRFEIISDGTDTLWDIPYFKILPYKLQKMFFMPAHWLLTYLFGFFPWHYGENYFCIAKKLNKAP